MWTDIVIPIGTFILGSVITWWTTSIQYKKKVVVSIDPEQTCFKAYNTGNAGLVIKEIGICQGASIWFSQTCDKALQAAADPLIVLYDEGDFWAKVESAIGGERPKDKFYCFVLSADGKKYKSVCAMKYKDFWNYHEWFWGRNPNKATESDLPF